MGMEGALACSATGVHFITQHSHGYNATIGGGGDCCQPLPTRTTVILHVVVSSDS